MFIVVEVWYWSRILKAKNTAFQSDDSLCVRLNNRLFSLTGLFQKDRKNQNAKIVLMIKLEVAISLSRVIDFIHDDVALTGRKNWGKNYNYIPIQVILKLSFSWSSKSQKLPCGRQSLYIVSKWCRKKSYQWPKLLFHNHQSEIQKKFKMKFLF